LSNNWQISDHFRHVLAVYSSYTDFKNPFITNYEKRKESTFGLRSYLEYFREEPAAGWRFTIGAESMQTSTDFDNFDNNQGTPGALQAADDLKATANFAFAQLSIDLHSRLLIELSSSVNLFKYTYKSIAPVAILKRQNTFDPQFMPRAALSYHIASMFYIRGSISKGYSPPTLAEVRGSNNVINTALDPEYGWNYETGFHYQLPDRRLVFDLTGFYYRLNQAITRRIDESDAEYFVNTGGTRQWGLEGNITYLLIPFQGNGLIRSVQFSTAYTLSRFRFHNYMDLSNDYSGNELTGVPKTVLISSADIRLPHSYRVFLQHNYTSAIPLNDANTLYASRYHLVQAKASKIFNIGHSPIELYIGADNLLNQKYSLGNDLNAFGGRYFNAAALRNFYGGLSMRL
jgi:iron complex outermembrane receptor protein